MALIKSYRGLAPKWGRDCYFSENAKLDQSYEHLCKMRDELVTLNIVPPISEWSKINPNL